MAKGYRGNGNIIDFNGIIETGITITAGSMVWSTGTATIVSPITAVAITAVLEGANFLGVLKDTQTGALPESGGHQTGVTVHRKGVFEFTTLATNTAISVIVGQEVWAAGPTTVRGVSTSATTLTGIAPLGICTWLDSPDASTVSVRCHVDIYPGRVLGLIARESGTADI